MDLEDPRPRISVIKKYPSQRDTFINGSWRWIEGKRADDNAEALWRVHDKLYDLTSFIPKHPGGQFWLEITRVRCSKLFWWNFKQVLKSIKVFERPWNSRQVFLLFLGHRHHWSFWESSYWRNSWGDSQELLRKGGRWPEKLFLHLRWKWILSDFEKARRWKA